MRNKPERIVFDNGVRVMLENVPDARTCSMGVWAASGSAFENAQQAGTSHFIEHMLFRGTARRSSTDIAEQTDEMGSMLNAYTSREYTCIYARSLAEHACGTFDIIGDMVTSPAMRQQDIESEKGIIGEEINMYEDSPEDLCVDRFYETVWGSDYMGGRILGSFESVNSMTAERLQEHMREFYAPERLVISFCGGFDREKVLAQCREFFASAANTGNPFVPMRAQYRRGVTVCEKDFEQNQIIIGFPGVSLRDEKGDYTVSLMSSILGESSSSRLFQSIRDRLGLVYSIDTSNVAYTDQGIFTLCMGVSPKSEEKAITQSIKILKDFASTITEKELARAKEQAVAGLVMGLEGVSSRASGNGRGELLYGGYPEEDSLSRKIRAITLDEVSAMAGRILDFSNVSLCAAGKVKSEDYYRSLLGF